MKKIAMILSILTLITSSGCAISKATESGSNGKITEKEYMEAVSLIDTWMKGRISGDRKVAEKVLYRDVDLVEELGGDSYSAIEGDYDYTYTYFALKNVDTKEAKKCYKDIIGRKFESAFQVDFGISFVDKNGQTSGDGCSYTMFKIDGEWYLVPDCDWYSSETVRDDDGRFIGVEFSESSGDIVTGYHPERLSDGSYSLVPIEDGKVVLSDGSEGYIKGSSIKLTMTSELAELSCEFTEIGKIVSASTLGRISAAVNDKGELYVWGSNEDGVLGIGMTEDEISYVERPIKILDNVMYVTLGQTGFGDVSGAAITNNNDLYTWGRGGSGQLGNGKCESNLKPEKILSNVTAVDIGVACMAAISDGALMTWGNNSLSRLGTGLNSYEMPDSYTPVWCMGDAVKVDLGMTHGAVINGNGELFIWGEHSSGQYGDGKDWSSDRSSYESPYHTKVFDGVVDVSCEEGATTFITGSGELYAAGKSNELLDDSVDKTYFNKVMDNAFDYNLHPQSTDNITVDENGVLYFDGINLFDSE